MRTFGFDLIRIAIDIRKKENARLEKQLAEAQSRIKELEDEISRVAVFLAIHGVDGYSMGEFTPNDANKTFQRKEDE